LKDRCFFFAFFAVKKRINRKERKEAQGTQDALGASKFCGQILETTGVVHCVLNDANYISGHKGIYWYSRFFVPLCGEKLENK